MTPLDLARLYFQKAKEDETAAAAFSNNPDISDAVIGFHCQQAVEKYLKALIAIQEERVAKFHDLAGLINQLRGLGINVPSEFERVTELTPFAVLVRYPFGPEPEPLDRPGTLALVAGIREWVARELG